MKAKKRAKSSQIKDLNSTELIRPIKTCFVYTANLSKELSDWLWNKSEGHIGSPSISLLYRSKMAEEARRDPDLEDNVDLFYQIVHLYESLHQYDIILFSDTIVVL